jgi:hypothetical protein
MKKKNYKDYEQPQNNEKMNVRFAATVLSNSEGDALTYLINEDPEFKECCPTAQFCKMINNAFDTLNSRRLFSKNPFNNAITSDTLTKYQEFTQLFSEYSIYTTIKVFR